jgi:hypothetical protein
MRDYAKMEESNLEQHGIITSLEHTYQDLREQHVTTHIEFNKDKQKFYYSNPRLEGSI